MKINQMFMINFKYGLENSDLYFFIQANVYLGNAHNCFSVL